MRHAPETLWRMYDDWKNHTGASRSIVNDIHIVAPMLIHLGKSNISERGERLPAPMDFYTCKHFDTTTNNCTIYFHRPQMCREFPYGDSCTFLDCEMTENCGVENVSHKIRPIMGQRLQQPLTGKEQEKLDEVLADVSAQLEEMHVPKEKP